MRSIILTKILDAQDSIVDYRPYCCCSVSQSCLTLCDPMDCSTPGLPVLHHLPKLAQTHVMPSNHFVFCHPLLLLSSIFPSIRVFSKSQFIASGGQVIGTSASASVFPMNIQDWSPLGLTGLISLQSKGCSRDFSNTRVQKREFFGA